MPEPSQVDRTDGVIDWPAWAPRTDPADRRRTSKFSVPLGQAIGEMETELEDRLGALEWRLSTAAPHRKKDGRPYADANPEDPGAVVRWTMPVEDQDEPGEFEVTCDLWTDLRDNVREIGRYLKEKRRMEDRPVKTRRSEFASARKQLPPGQEGGGDTIVAEDPLGGRSPQEVLGVPEALEPGQLDEHDREYVEEKARQLKGRHHPDGEDPDREEWRAVREAEAVMLDE